MLHANSKFAKVPLPTRLQVNHMILNGCTADELIKWLAEEGYPGFNEANISRYKSNAYQDWLGANEIAESAETIQELAQTEPVKESPLYHDAAVSIIGMRFFQTLNRIPADVWSRIAEKNPAQLIPFIRAFTHFNRYCLQNKQFQRDAASKSSEDGASTTKELIPIREETFERICREKGYI